MAVYFVTGKLGSGKTLVAVGRMREYLVKDSRIAAYSEVVDGERDLSGSGRGLKAEGRVGLLNNVMPLYSSSQ